MNGFKELSEYYNVSVDEAVLLGKRAPNRMPDLPPSRTTKALSGMTYEDIWKLKERKTEQDIFDFYKDQCAWSSFRQMNHHGSPQSIEFHLDILEQMIRPRTVLCEYGCGIAPFSHTLLTRLQDPDMYMTIFISDVDSEHFHFAQWRLSKVIEEQKLINVSLYAIYIKPNELPSYPTSFDSLIAFEVLEHVQSPLDVFGNLNKHMRAGSFFCENFILHNPDQHDDESDLENAKLERTPYYDMLDSDYRLVYGLDPTIASDGTRVWKKK